MKRKILLILLLLIPFTSCTNKVVENNEGYGEVVIDTKHASASPEDFINISDNINNSTSPIITQSKEHPVYLYGQDFPTKPTTNGYDEPVVITTPDENGELNVKETLYMPQDQVTTDYIAKIVLQKLLKSDKYANMVSTEDHGDFSYVIFHDVVALDNYYTENYEVVYDDPYRTDCSVPDEVALSFYKAFDLSIKAYYPDRHLFYYDMAYPVTVGKLKGELFPFE